MFHAVIYYTYNIYLMFLFIRLFSQQIFPVDSIIQAPKKEERSEYNKRKGVKGSSFIIKAYAVASFE